MPADLPPAYSESATAPNDPIVYDAPTSWAVGAKTLARPLVRVGELKAHLALLRAFKALRTLVEDGQIAEWPDVVRLLDPSQRWIWFVGLAVDRFQRWIDVLGSASLGTTLEYELPPLDVVMIWHAYLLNPTWYAEDCLRMAPLNPLRGVRDHLLSALVRIGDVSSFDVSSERKKLWLRKTGLPYDPISAATLATTHAVSCPKCLQNMSVPYILLEGTGYLQSKFRTTCPACGFHVDRDGLATLKFVRDLVLDPRSERDKRRYGNGVYLAGSLRTLIHPCDEIFASALKIKLFVVVPPPEGNSATVDKDEWIKAIMKQVSYSMETVRKISAPAFSGSERRSARILSAYFDDRPFSVELVGATIRQGSFVDEMQSLSWNDPSRMEGDALLQHAIARYHAFLDLTASTLSSFFVPTLDIDLAWHTHLMKGEAYQADCSTHIGRFVDHEDKVDENRLAAALDD
ncbi:hypothetical protein PHLGIDRAFT_112238, partial [Phlebiopsis gigantea 11061_1 CR5-6]